MIKVFNFKVCRKSRIMDSMSSLSLWLKCWTSTISCCAFWYLSHNFCSLAVNFCTCSSCVAHFVSSSMFSCRWSSSCLFSSASFSCCFLNRFFSFLSSCSCSMAFSMTCLPTTIFSSIFTSLLCISCFRTASAFSSRFWASISAMSLLFSEPTSSVRAMISALRSSASRLRLSFCSRSSASSRAFSSSLAPPFIITSFSTTFSTIFSTYSVFFSIRGGRGPPTPPSPPCPPSPPFIMSSPLRRMISSWNSRIMASLGSSLIRGLFLMLFAR
mmetsp:Transcript_46801/g.142061  ORF Transcript_46801/g.142061 Transcript_46801/m.142061 type:complete len:271 (+) Transcript_46801:617-1429(+)